MTALAGVFLFAAALVAFLAGVAMLRLRTTLERLHAAALVNVLAGGLVLLAVLLDQGFGSAALKVALIWLALLVPGAVAAHAVGRAVHLRGGERR